MRFEGLDLNLLLALDMLLECRSTTEAARRLNMSQPTVSSALGRLREYFGDDLLVNAGREMVPTPFAEDLAPAITELLNIARFRIVQSEEFDPATSRRRFKILASDYVFDVILAKAFAKAARTSPGISFDVSSIGPQGGRLFQKGDVDLMITVPPFKIEGFPSELLFADRSAVICWKEGKYAGGIDEAAFLSADFVKAVFGEERRPSISEIHFSESGLQLNTCLLVPNFSFLPGAVCGTDRIAVMHSLHAQFYQRMYPLACHPLPVPGTEVSEIMQWHPLRRKDPGLRWLRDLLRQEADMLIPASHHK